MKPLKRSFTIAGHSTSISLEAPFWEALREAARERGQSVAALVEEIDRERGASGLSSAVRVWILEYCRGNRPHAEDAASRQVPEPSGRGH
ncbi:MAG: ribbon-helix-helix domain-containing protein [Hyphomicrobiaceae bacterium]|nr:ribbon-helix-helix domain-containing protein [Hyphomicrobiaceae bacterium]